ncbi:MAG: AI-2E family transporter [Solirubrobacterales bacterium]|nr:AI-2E family transporter [Solirubrobacterales bacterium]
MRRLSEPVRAVLLAATLGVTYLAFHELVTLLVILVITMIIAIPLAATADRFERRGLPRVLGALMGLLLGFAAFAGLLALVVPTFVDQGQRAVDAIPSTFDNVRFRISDATGADAGEVGQSIQSYVQGYVDEPSRLIGPAAQIGLGIVGLLGTFLVVLLTAFYIALRPRPLIDGLLSLFPARRRDDAARVLGEIRSAWMGWLRGVGIDIIVTGTLLYIGLLLVGLDFALVFAVIGGLFVVVPYIGAVAGGIPPVLFALADSPTKAALVLGVYLLVQQIEGNVIIPVVMSRQVALHPAVIIIGVIVVGRVVGFAGLLVAVPLISATLILVRALWVEPMAREDERRQEPFDAVRTASASSPTRALTSTSSRQ